METSKLGGPRHRSRLRRLIASRPLVLGATVAFSLALLSFFFFQLNFLNAGDDTTLSEKAIKEGNYGQAELHLLRALEASERRVGRQDASLVPLLNALARVYAKEGKPEQSADLFRRSQIIAEAVARPGLLQVAESLDGLSNACAAQGKWEQARTLAEQSLSIRRANLPANSSAVAASENSLAPVLLAQGQSGPAQELFKDSLAVFESSEGSNSALTTNVRNNLAASYVATSNFQTAEPMLLNSLHSYEKVYGVNHPEVAVVVNNLGELYRAQGDCARAGNCYRRALSIYERHPEFKDSVWRGTVLNNLALSEAAMGKSRDAEAHLQEAIAVFQSDGPGASLNLSNAVKNYNALKPKLSLSISG